MSQTSLDIPHPSPGRTRSSQPRPPSPRRPWAAGATRATAESPTIRQQVVHRAWMRTRTRVCAQDRGSRLAPHTSLLSNLSFVSRSPQRRRRAVPPCLFYMADHTITQLLRGLTTTPPPFSNGVAVLPQRPLGQVEPGSTTLPAHRFPHGARTVGGAPPEQCVEAYVS